MDPLSDNKQPFPKYLIVVFALILAIVGFGIGQKIYKPDNLPTVLGTSDTDISSQTVSVAQIPVIKDGSLDPNCRAKNIILLDADSKYMMYGKGAHSQVSIASITKLMTAILVVESGKLDDTVTIEYNDINVIGSKIGYKTDEKIKVSEVLKSLLMNSGNDAANVLARTIGGSSDEFVKKMNAKTTELGLTNTKYTDPHGLSSQSYSTAFDQAVILSYALNIPKIREVISSSEGTAVSEDGTVHELKNSNRLITDELKYDGAIGGKTGYTVEAGHSLASAARRDSHTLISVVLNTDYSTNDASAQETAKLLDWGFENFEWK